MGQRLVLHEAVLTGRKKGLLVQVHCIEISSFEARDFASDQRRAVREILGAVLSPHFELTVVGRYGLDMLPALLACCGIAGRGVGKRAIKVILRRLEP